MKLVIAGSRNLEVEDSFLYKTLCHFDIYNKVVSLDFTIITGGASGIDKCAEDFAKTSKFPLKVIPAAWEDHGKAAGPIRNKEMAKEGDALLLIWDGQSKGSANMKKEMLSLKKPVYEVILKKYNV